MSDPLSFSFELFPPRTPEAAEKLPATIDRLAALGPNYFSVTYGAGGSDQDGTYETITQVGKLTTIEAAPHLTCIGSTRASIEVLLNRYKDAGVKRIVALRGDLPATASSAKAPGELHFASELVAFIRERFGNHFKLEVAAYPEMHPQAEGLDQDFAYFCRKIEAGADAALTQLFYNAEAYFHFLERCTKSGIKAPIMPGIMPITGYSNVVRFCNNCGADMPRWIRLRLESLQHDKPSLLDFGLDVVARLCENLLNGGAPGLHFYTVNQAEPCVRLWRALGLAENDPR